jgi:hypothetical protein
MKTGKWWRPDNNLVKAETKSSFVKLSSSEPKSCKYKQSGMLQGWNKRSISRGVAEKAQCLVCRLVKDE